MSSTSQGNSEQRTVIKALKAAKGTASASSWSELRKELKLQMNTANLKATSKALKGRGEVRLYDSEGSINLVLI
jgi:hypothetical protein